MTEIPQPRRSPEEVYEQWMERQLEEALSSPLPQRVVDRLVLILGEE